MWFVTVSQIIGSNRGSDRISRDYPAVVLTIVVREPDPGAGSSGMFSGGVEQVV